MKKRLTMALAAGALVAAMVPGVASAGPPAGTKTEICHFSHHETEVLTTVGTETVSDFYYDVPGGTLTSFFEEACGWWGGRVISVSSKALHGHHATGETALPTD